MSERWTASLILQTKIQNVFLASSPHNLTQTHRISVVKTCYSFTQISELPKDRCLLPKRVAEILK